MVTKTEDLGWLQEVNHELKIQAFEVKNSNTSKHIKQVLLEAFKRESPQSKGYSEHRVVVIEIGES